MTSTDTQRNRPSYANNLKLLVDESSSRFFPDNLCRYFHIKCCDPGCWYTSEMSHVGLNELVGRSLAGGQQFSVQVHIYMSHLFHVCALDTWPTARKPSIGVTPITLAQIIIPRTTNQLADIYLRFSFSANSAFLAMICSSRIVTFTRSRKIYNPVKVNSVAHMT